MEVYHFESVYSTLPTLIILFNQDGLVLLHVILLIIVSGCVELYFISGER